MKQYIFLLALVALSLSIFGQNPNPSSAIDIAIANVMNAQNIPGVSTVVVRDGEIVWMESYGYANTDLSTPYTDVTSLLIASISKVFTATALMQLFEKGLLNLDDDINGYLPFDIEIPKFESKKITFKMLLTHTSSIRDGDAMDNFYNWSGDPTISLADCIQSYFSPDGSEYHPKENFIKKAPGTVYEYSNMAVALEGYLVERISGMPFNAYCNQNILEPLCMDNTHWYLSEYENLDMLANPHEYYGGNYQPVDHFGFADYPDGMLHSNAKDMANFMISMLQGGVFRDKSILMASTLDDMFSPQIPEIDNTQGLQYYKEIFNVSSGNISFWGHNGSELGISTEMILDLDKEIGVAAFANSEGIAVEILELLYDYGLTLVASGTGNPICSTTGPVDAPKYLFLYDVFPNPANSMITFRSDNLDISTHEIVISDLTGRAMTAFVKNDYELTIDVSNFPDGIYFYAIKEEGETIDSGKLIIIH